MVKVRLKGSPQTQWQIDGRMFPGRDLVELTEAQLLKHKDIIESVLEELIVPLEKESILEEVPKEQESKKIYSKEELLAMNKGQQVLLLNELGMLLIPRLEKDRVEAILKAQKN